MTKIESAVLEFTRVTALTAGDPKPENLRALVLAAHDLSALALEQERQLERAEDGTA